MKAYINKEEKGFLIVEKDSYTKFLVVHQL
jgi:hypothetical protein